MTSRELVQQRFDYSNHKLPIRVGILSDTHGEIADGVLAALADSDVILHAGDICGQTVLTQLSAINPNVVAVGGNNDRRFPYSTDPLPEVAQVALPGGTISLLHGHQFGAIRPCHDAMRAEFPGSKGIIYGHSHHQVHADEGAPWLLNPGAAGHTRTNGGSACAQLDIDGANWQIRLIRC